MAPKLLISVAQPSNSPCFTQGGGPLHLDQFASLFVSQWTRGQDRGRFSVVSDIVKRICPRPRLPLLNSRCPTSRNLMSAISMRQELVLIFSRYLHRATPLVTTSIEASCPKNPLRILSDVARHEFRRGLSGSITFLRNRFKTRSSKLSNGTLKTTCRELLAGIVAYERLLANHASDVANVSLADAAA